jgi:hypothetical protein
LGLGDAGKQGFTHVKRVIFDEAAIVFGYR